MVKIFDIVIIGAGALGISCAYKLGKGGHKIALFDQFPIPHSKGSSYGGTRLFRQAYFEDERYIPLLKESYQLWNSWQNELETQLLYENGYLTIFNRSSDIAQKMQQNAQKWDIKGQELNSQQLEANFPQFQNTSSFSGYLEKQAGILDVDTVFGKCLNHFASQGGEIYAGEKVLGWQLDSNNYIIQTDKGNYRCRKIIFTPGAWLREMPSLCDMEFTVKRGAQFWCQSTVNFSVEMPCFAFAIDKEYIFGFPPFAGKGVKIANYHPSDVIEDLDLPRREYTKKEFQSVYNIAQSFFPWLSPTPDDFHICMYTLTKDEDFVLDYLRADRNILILGGGSGHAFKFIPFLATEVSKFFPEGGDIPSRLQFFSLR